MVRTFLEKTPLFGSTKKQVPIVVTSSQSFHLLLYRVSVPEADEPCKVIRLIVGLRAGSPSCTPPTPAPRTKPESGSERSSHLPTDAQLCASVLNEGRGHPSTPAPTPEDFWQCLQTFVVVATGRGTCYWLLG